MLPAQNQIAPRYPLSGEKAGEGEGRKKEKDMTNLADFKNQSWQETRDGRTINCQQVVGNSGVYLVETDAESGEVLRDDRPWQMRGGLS